MFSFHIYPPCPYYAGFHRSTRRSSSISSTKRENKGKPNVTEPQSHKKKRSNSNDQQRESNIDSAANSTESAVAKYDQKMSYNRRPTYYPIAYYVKEFLQRQADYAWFMSPYSKCIQSDHFHSLVVHSTFPTTLTLEDFDYYIDMTFSEFSEDLRKRMKHLFHTNQNSPVLEDIRHVINTDGTMTAILVQILTQRNSRNELEMVVGSVSCTRRLCNDRQSRQDYWNTNKDRIKTALQYVFGKEAEKELTQLTQSITDL